MIKPQPLTAERHINLLVYGITGAGKTRFAGSGENALIIRPPTEHTASIPDPDSRGIQEVIVNGWDDMNEVFDHLESEGDNYDWVWLDSISAFQDIGLDDIWAKVIAEKPHRKKFGLDKSEYGVNMHRLSVWLRHVVGMNKFNFGVTAHPFESEGPDGEMLWMPYVQGRGMSQKVSGYMHMVGYLHVKKVKSGGKLRDARILELAASEHYYAKDQFDAFAKGRLVDPTLPAVEKAVKAARGGTPRKSKKTTRKRSS